MSSLNEIYDKNRRDELFEFLENLRISGITNMFGAGAYLEKAFGLDKKDASSVLIDWMQHKEQEAPKHKPKPKTR